MEDIKLKELLCLLRKKEFDQYVDIDTMTIVDSPEKGKDEFVGLNIVGNAYKMDRLYDFISDLDDGWGKIQDVINGDFWACMYDYQKEAANYILGLKGGIINGGILGLGMGMGKTITSLGIVEKSCPDKTLVVCSKVLLDGWVNDGIEKFYKGIWSYIILHSEYVKDPENLDLDPYDIVITTHDYIKTQWKKDGDNIKSIVVKRIQCIDEEWVRGEEVWSENEFNEHNKEAEHNKDMTKAYIHSIVKNRNIEGSKTNMYNRKWGTIIFDEVSAFTNHKSVAAKALTALVGDFYVILSGTPLVNRNSDLYSSLRIMGLEITSKQWGESYFKKNNLIKHVYIKTPQEVGLEFPETNIQLVKVKPLPDEKVIYRYIIMRLLEKYSLHNIGEIHYHESLQMLTQLKFATNTLRLLTEGDSKIEYLYENDDSVDILTNPNYISAKTLAIVDKVGELKGKSIIVFTTYVKYMKILKNHINNKHPDVSVELLHGGISKESKKRFVDEINSGELDILFIQMKVGSAGLNIQGADVVFIVDPPYNMATEQQAIARACRIGRKEPIDVYTFIVSGSFEEYVIDIQLKKEGERLRFLGNENSMCELEEVEERKINKNIIEWLSKQNI